MVSLPAIDRQKELVSNYEKIANTVRETAKKYVKHQVQLIAVSKFKPSGDILTLYNQGVRHFGENYVQELVTKSQELPSDIKWHFIGTLQTDKCKILAKQIPNLYAVETIDSIKKCRKLNSLRKEIGGDIINVFLQINTSNEPQKSGYSINDESDKQLIYQTIEYLMSDECSHLNCKGLMTIGSLGESTKDDENQDFRRLITLKDELNEKYNVDLQTSMGMSNDFEEAIKQGSSNVRVGSSIFGSRPPKSNS